MDKSTDKSIVWAPHPVEGFVLGRVVDIGGETITVDPVNAPGKLIEATYDRVFVAAETDKDVDDNCTLMYLNEGTLLNNIRLRYKKNIIYTYVANILIAVNPYFEVPNLYSKETIKKYQGKSLGQLPPHVFAMGDKAFRDMRTFKESQSIIVSGESGSGKTETTKYILKHLVECYGVQAGPIEQRILESNPLLEAFGNAKTVRNNNSSRFGKFVEIHFDAKSQVTGGFISHYLLEKSRICVQSSGERNYHIFFRLCAGADAEMRKRLQLSAPDNFHYLRRGSTQYFCTKDTEKRISKEQKSAEFLKHGYLKDIQMDDVKDFLTTDKAMTDMGVSTKERMEIYQVLAAILHLGNVIFEDAQSTQGGCQVRSATRPSMQLSAELLGIKFEVLQESLLTRVTQAARGGAQDSTIKIALRTEEAVSARDALAKAIYSRLFDHIVGRVNQALPFKSSASYIGVLDIAGFEYFERNSFEQFCINYCNEKLQQFFNERVLKEEQVLYEREGLGLNKISYNDNHDCIDLIERRSTGIFDLLDEESRLPKPTPDHFTTELHIKNQGHFRLMYPRKSQLKAHREVRDSEGFIVRHFAGAVCYHTEQFIEKNNDALHASLEGLMITSTLTLVKDLFKEEPQAKPTGPGAGVVRKSGAGKLNFVSVGSKFRTQLSTLLEKLKSTGTNFIRCLKPNTRMVDHCFEGGNVLAQLQCSGMPQVLELMQQGFPSRTKFDELYNMYKKHLPPQLSRLDPRLFCRLLFKALGLNSRDFRFGVTKVFFRPGKFAEFDALMRSDPASLAEMVKKVKKWLVRYRWRKAQYCTWEVIKLRNKIRWRRQQIVRIQKTMRMWICCKKYRPRIQTLTRLALLQKQIPNLQKLAQQLKKEKEKAACQQQVEQLSRQFESAKQELRTRAKWSPAELQQIVQKMSMALDAQMVALKKAMEAEKAREEQKRLQRIQEQLEAEKKRQTELERKQREEEEEKKMKARMEEERRKSEASRAAQEEADRRAAQTLQRQMEQEAGQRAKVSEQERLDHELALRLASGDANAVEDLGVPGSRSSASLASRSLSIKKAGSDLPDLTSWKYAELRDTLNTSCDVALLTACREEFHRRLKVYNDWKKRNQQKTVAGSEKAGPSSAAASMPMDFLDRAPASILENANSPASSGSPTKARTGANDGAGDPKAQRYFRIPFSRPLASGSTGVTHTSEGTWWVHFDGQYVARQMEVHPNVDADLRLAGVDDARMLELGLTESGLLKKKGAGITEAEFEREWQRHGGVEYMKKHMKSLGSLYLQKRVAAK